MDDFDSVSSSEVESKSMIWDGWVLECFDVDRAGEDWKGLGDRNEWFWEDLNVRDSNAGVLVWTELGWSDFELICELWRQATDGVDLVPP